MPKGDLNKSSRHLISASNFPHKICAWFNRGNCCYWNGDYAGAIADYTRAIGRDPGHAIVYSNRGNARRANGDMAGAMNDYNQALAIDPRCAMAFLNRGIGYLQQGHGILNSSYGEAAQPRQVALLFPRSRQCRERRLLTTKIGRESSATCRGCAAFSTRLTPKPRNLDRLRYFFRGAVNVVSDAF